jgi:hypothetical protein
MSSDMFSRVLTLQSLILYTQELKKYGTGRNLIIVKEEILGKSGRTIPVSWITRNTLRQRACIILHLFSCVCITH